VREGRNKGEGKNRAGLRGSRKLSGMSFTTRHYFTGVLNQTRH
jgi:hypothetical protein